MKVSDPVLEFIKTKAASETKVEKAILFGSRARGDHRERSDYDVAIVAPSFSEQEWALFALELQEQVASLCGLDLVLMAEGTSRELREKIEAEGRVFFKR